MNDHQTLEHTLYWLQAIRFQGERTLSAEKIENILFYQNTKMIEEQFFLNAINKAIRWSQELKSLDCCTQEIDKFLLISSFANLVRNKREHDDEYFGPKARNEKMTELPKEENRASITVGQSITMHKNGKILLGGTVDIHDVIVKSEELISVLIKKQREYTLSKSINDINIAKQYFAPDDLISK